MALRLIKFLIGLVGVAAIGVVAIHWSGGAGRAEKALSERLTQTLAEHGFTWATADIDRTRIILVGAAPDENAARRAEETARAVINSSGILFNANSVIESRFEIPEDQPAVPETIVTAEETASEEPQARAPAREEPSVEEPVAEAPSEAERRQAQLQACRQEVGALIAATPIRFNSGGAAIGGDDSAVLDAVIGALAQCPDAQIVVAGHTDATGSAAGNLALSQRRAEAVAAYLAERLPDATQIGATGYGESRPIAANSTREGRAQNRRIEIAITSSSVED